MALVNDLPIEARNFARMLGSIAGLTSAGL
jgi:hypothetical protein